MYNRSVIGIDGDRLFYRHTPIDPHRKTLLFIHGLGDSGLAFREAFIEAVLRDFNIIVPDLPGYGKSKSEHDGEKDYAFAKQAARLYELLNYLGIEKFCLVGHSMGGDLGTLMCTKYSQNRIQAFVNIEGDLTQGDRFITDAALEAHGRGSDYFEKWLRSELIDIIFAGQRDKFVRSRNRYQKSLRCCSANAFWVNVEEIRSLNEDLPGCNYAEAAKLFAGIQIPKVFCWGRESIQSNSQTRTYLNAKPFCQQPFDAFHWIMLDQRKEFYNYLVKFFV